MQDGRNFGKSTPYDLFSDFEGTLVVPEISYKEWILPKVADRERFEQEYETRRKRAREEKSTQAWEHYLDLYSKFFSIRDFKDMSSQYSMNKVFQSWSKRFFKVHGYSNVTLTILTRGFVPIVKSYFERSDVKPIMRNLGISLGNVIGSEPSMDNTGVMKGIKSTIFAKRKFVKDGHVMLGDDGDEWEFKNYPYFVNLSKLRGSE